MTKKEEVTQIIKNNVHISFDEIYKIYNVTSSITRQYLSKILQELKEEKIITSVRFDDFPLLYEINVGKHDHFICRECGSVMNVNSKVFAQAVSLDGNTCDEIRIVLYGKCASCLNKKVLN